MNIADFRPSKIGELFGQEHLQDTLNNWLQNPSIIPKALLISGPYGTGKTTIARMLAAKLATVKRDIEEINAAEARGIDDARQWSESARYCPLGDARVYIIDELHQMTTAAQSALLKVIEEPPKAVYFFLCTTEPSRLLPAIGSRCVKLSVRLLSEESLDELAGYLTKGRAKPEHVTAIHHKTQGHARDAVKLLATLEENSYRDGLLDQVGLQVEEVRRMLMANTMNSYQFKALVYNTDLQLLATLVDEIVDQAVVSVCLEFIKDYGEFLTFRNLRREYKITGQEQVMHYLTKKIGYGTLKITE